MAQHEGVDLSNEVEAVQTWANLLRSVAEANKYTQNRDVANMLAAVRTQYERACAAFLSKGGFTTEAPELVPARMAPPPAYTPYVGADGRSGGTPSGHAG